MKDPKALFPYLFASSWLGDLILTVLAFYLAFTHSGPLTPLVFFTVALCILAGNLLPIGAYLVFVRWRGTELKMQSMEADVRVRDALRRSEEIMGRLDEAEGAVSKAVLVARQVPERIAEKMQGFDRLSDAINTDELTGLADSFAANARSTDSLRTEAEAIRESVNALKQELAALPASVGEVVRESIPEPPAAADSGDDVSVGERLDLLFESLEAIQDSMDSLLERIARLEQAPARKKAPAPKPEAQSGTEPAPEAAAEARPGPEPSPPSGPAVPPEPDPQQEMELAGDAPDNSAPPPKTVPPDTLSLSVHAMIGMRNKLYIRGDEPWLSWDAGQPMELIGIGEFSWESSEPNEPIEVAVYLNDETPARGGTIRLEPGKPVRVEPEFDA